MRGERGMERMRSRRLQGGGGESGKETEGWEGVGEDEISGEVWKYGGERLMECLWKLCNRVWREKDWIEEWNDGIIVSIRKKRDGERVEDYRGG